MTEKFIQEAIKHPGRVHTYVSREFGPNAFYRRGTIKPGYLISAKRLAEKNNDKDLVKAIDLAIELRKFNRARA